MIDLKNPEVKKAYEHFLMTAENYIVHADMVDSAFLGTGNYSNISGIHYPEQSVDLLTDASQQMNEKIILAEEMPPLIHQTIGAPEIMTLANGLSHVMTTNTGFSTRRYNTQHPLVHILENTSVASKFMSLATDDESNKKPTLDLQENMIGFFVDEAAKIVADKPRILEILDEMKGSTAEMFAACKELGFAFKHTLVA